MLVVVPVVGLVVLVPATNGQLGHVYNLIIGHVYKYEHTAVLASMRYSY